MIDKCIATHAFL